MSLAWLGDFNGEWAAQDGWLAALFVAISAFQVNVAAGDRSTVHKQTEQLEQGKRLAGQ